jgi:hypothetical protein
MILHCLVGMRNGYVTEGMVSRQFFRDEQNLADELVRLASRQQLLFGEADLKTHYIVDNNLSDKV